MATQAIRELQAIIDKHGDLELIWGKNSYCNEIDNIDALIYNGRKRTVLS